MLAHHAAPTWAPDYHITLMRANPSSNEIAANRHTSAHSPQPAHSPSSTTARYPDEAIMGVPLRWAFIAPAAAGAAVADGVEAAEHRIFVVVDTMNKRCSL